MFNWLTNILAKPLLPILEQGYTVIALVKPAIEEFVAKAVELGITPGSTLYTTLTNIKDAVIAIEAVIVKTIQFLGGTVPSLAAVDASSLESEVAKLQALLK